MDQAEGFIIYRHWTGVRTVDRTLLDRSWTGFDGTKLAQVPAGQLNAELSQRDNQLAQASFASDRS